MSDNRKKMGGRKAAKESMSQNDPPSKLEMKILKWVRHNVPTKKTKFLHSHVVEYFTGSKAVDALVNDSPWGKDNAKETDEIKFVYRESAVEFLDDMLKHKKFHRARKIPVKEKEKKKKTKKDDKTDKTDTEVEATPKVDNSNDQTQQKKKRKIRLDMHLDQVFLDTQDAYVWLYDPIPWYYWVGGTGIVLAIIAICLFPLWPPIMRKGVHYLSIAAAGFLIFIIGLGVLKYIIFALLFALSTGKLRFWIFPNLTEDVGFFESFVPIYDYTFTGSSKEKTKDSDDEESDDEEDDRDKAENSESDESTSKKSSTGKDFEMVDKNDTDVQDD